MNEHKSFTDFHLCIALIASGHQLIKLKNTGSNRIEFVFDNSKRLEELANQFYSQKLSVDAQTLFNVQRNLKSQLHDFQQNQNR